MHIFIDETKKLAQWEIIFWWFLTNYRSSSVDKFYQEFLEENWIKETNWEIKSYESRFKKKIPKIFQKIKKKDSFYFKAFWVKITWYKESLKNYTKAVENIIEILSPYLIQGKWWINITADSVKLWTKNKPATYISKILSNKYNLKLSFYFQNSKNSWGLKIADFVCWELRQSYLKWIYSKEINPNLKEFLLYIKKEDIRSGGS